MRRIAAIFLVLLSAEIQAGDFDFGTDLELQSRAFPGTAAWSGQDNRALQFSLGWTSELRWRSETGNTRGSLIPYLRWDGTDSERSLIDLKEAYLAFEGDEHEILAGANTVFWGVTESVHLVDIINQTDFAGDIDGEDKLGQPMVSFTLQKDWGELTAFVLPYFRERTFAGPDGRFRPPLPIDADRPLYESSEGQNHIDLSLRYSHYFGDVDLGLSAFSGTSREPRFVPSEDGTALLPLYDQINQVGVDLQYTRDAWLWKLEAIARDGATETFAAAVGGFEYTVFQVRETDADLGLLLEYQYDGRSEEEPFTIADNDVFIGARLALNDVSDTAVLAGVSWDHRTNETFLSIVAERRFGDNWFGELRVRAFSGAKPGDTTYWFQRDDYIQLSISRFF